MRILFVTDGIHPFVLGGMQKHAAYAIRALAQSEHFVDVVITGPKIESALEAEKVFWGDDVPNRVQFHFVPFPGLPKFPGHYLVASYLYARRLTKYFTHKISTPDIIYSKGFVLWHYLRKRDWSETPVITQLHGLEMYQPGFSLVEKINKWLMRLPAGFIIKNSDFHLAYGGKIKEILLGMGVKETAIFEQFGAVNDFWLKPVPAAKQNSDTRQFLFVARNEYRKGYHILKKALQQLIHERVDFNIKIVGDVQESDKIIHPNVNYTGSLGAEELKLLKETAEVLLVPSLSEGFPTIIIEAMARGLCIAATDVGAVSFVVNDNNGWLMNPGSTDSLVETMKLAISASKHELEKKQNNAMAKVTDEFNWDSAGKSLISQLEKAAYDYRQRFIGKKPETGR